MAIEEIVSILNGAKFRKSNATLNFQNESKIALQLVTDILHTIAAKPELPPPSPFLHQIKRTMLNINTPTPYPKPDTIKSIPTKDDTSLPRVKGFQPKTTNNNHPFEPNKFKTHDTHTSYKNNAVIQLKLQYLKQQLMFHIYNKKTGKKETVRSLLKNPETAIIWSKSASNEFGRLMKGNEAGIKGTNTMEPCHLHEIPSSKAITYGTIVCDERPQKSEMYRSRLVVGGDKLPYHHDCAAPAANLLEAKLIFNSTISQPGAKFCGIDIKDFFYHPLCRSQNT